MGYPDVIIADGAFAYWRLGEASGATADNYEGTPGYDGTYVGAPTLGVAGAAGDGDTACTFHSSAYLDIAGELGTFGSNIGTTGIAVEVWAKYTETDPLYYFAAKSATGYKTFVYVRANSNASLVGNVTFYLTPDSNAAASTVTASPTSNPGLNDGAWHHVVCVWDPSSPRACVVYIDGVSQSLTYIRTGDPTSGTFEDFDDGVRIGTSNVGTKGELWTCDEFAIYDGTLTAAQVLNHYNVGGAGGSSLGGGAMPLFHGGTPAPNTGGGSLLLFQGGAGGDSGIIPRAAYYARQRGAA